MNPQQAFLELLLAAMKDAVLEDKITQMKSTIDPDGKGIREVRIVIMPEKMKLNWPHDKPLGWEPKKV